MSHEKEGGPIHRRNAVLFCQGLNRAIHDSLLVWFHMVKVDEFDAVNAVVGSFVVIDEEKGNDGDTSVSNYSTTTSTSRDEDDAECIVRPDRSLCTDAMETSNQFETDPDRDTPFTKDVECSPASLDCELAPNLQNGNCPSSIDDEDVESMFQRARQLRHHRYTSRPYGILGLYQHLGDVRGDYDWARTAVRRRKQQKPYLAWSAYQELKKLRHHRQTQTLRWFANGLFLASTVLLLLSIAMNGWRMESMSVNPMVGPSAASLLRLGALQRSSIVVKKEWYRILTAIPLHAGVLHWFMNGAATLWMSRSLLRAETPSCSRRFVVAFLAAAIGGNVCSAAYSPFTVSMGASGGLFGWLGYCFADVVANFRVLSRSDEGYPFPRRRAIAWLALDLCLLIGLGMTPYIDNFAHMGGFLSGIGIGWSGRGSPSAGTVLAESTSGRGCSRRLSAIWHSVRRHWAMILVMLVTSLHAGLLVRSDSNQDVCKKCRYLSCVPFPFFTENKWWHCDSCEYCSVQTVSDPGSGISWLEITCPYGEVLKRPYPDQLTSDAILGTMVPQTCRESCSL